MKTEKMSIHRGLAELKLIDKKIEKAISTINPVGVIQKGEEKKVNNSYDLNEFNSDAASKYQSINDLMKRKVAIKSAIVKANGETEVTISNQKMSIADAINSRSLVALKKQLVNHLKTANNHNKGKMITHNETVDANALKIAEASGAKDADYETITKSYCDTNKVSLVDPLKVESVIEELEKEISEFETEIDYVLSEINAVTLIEI